MHYRDIVALCIGTALSGRGRMTLEVGHRKMKRLYPLPQAIVLIGMIAAPLHAEYCLAPVRPFLPADTHDAARYRDLIVADFETYASNVQRYLACLDEERRRAFVEAQMVSQEFGEFLRSVGED